MLTSRYRTVSREATVIVLVGLALAGCKSSTPAASNSPAATTTAATTPAATTPATTTPAASAAATPTATPAATSAPATGAALTTLPAHCPTAAQVSSALAITAPDPGESRTATALNCAYISRSVKNSLSINFSTAKKIDPAKALAALKAQGTTAHFQAVPGVGDAAYYDTAPTGGAYIAAVSGGLSFHIVAAGVTSLPGLTALAKEILAQ